MAVGATVTSLWARAHTQTQTHTHARTCALTHARTLASTLARSHACVYTEVGAIYDGVAVISGPSVGVLGDECLQKRRIPITSVSCPTDPTGLCIYRRQHRECTGDVRPDAGTPPPPHCHAAPTKPPCQTLLRGVGSSAFFGSRFLNHLIASGS